MMGDERFEIEDNLPLSDTPHLGESTCGVAPVVDGQDRHGNVEGGVGEWKFLSHALDDRCRVGSALRDHPP